MTSDGCNGALFGDRSVVVEADRISFLKSDGQTLEEECCLNNLPKVITWQRLGRELNSRPLESQANAFTVTLHYKQDTH